MLKAERAHFVYSFSREPVSQLRSVTCHMRSQCYLTYPEGIEG